MSDTKICDGCGTEFHRTPGTGFDCWERRRFCTRHCANKHKNSRQRNNAPPPIIPLMAQQYIRGLPLAQHE